MNQHEVTITEADAELIARAVLRLQREQKVEAPRRDLYTYEQAAERIGRTPQAVKQMVYRKQLRAEHPQGGRRALIADAEIEKYLGRKSHRRSR